MPLSLPIRRSSDLFELPIALRGIPFPAVILPLVPLARIVGGVDPRLAIARDVTHPRRRCAALATIDPLRILAARDLEAIGRARELHALSRHRRNLLQRQDRKSVV